MPALDLSAITHLLGQGQQFELTEEQYEAIVKRPLPQTNYLKKRSSVAKKAKEFGFSIEVEDRIHRVLIFKKKEGV